MELIEVVSERMKALLEAYDYSQYMLFLKSGVPRSTISMILNCRVTDVRLSTLYNFCRGFELPVAEKSYDFHRQNGDGDAYRDLAEVCDAINFQPRKDNYGDKNRNQDEKEKIKHAALPPLRPVFRLRAVFSYAAGIVL